MDAVARRAELSKGALYLYFDSKDALCAAIAARYLHEFLPRIKGSTQATATGIDKLRAMLETYAEWFEEHPHMFRFAISWHVPGQGLNTESPSFSEYRRLVGEITELGIDATRLGQRDGTIHGDLDPHMVSIQMWMSLLGVLMAHLGGDDFEKRLPFEIDMNSVIPFHIEQCLRAISGPRCLPGARAARPLETSHLPVGGPTATNAFHEENDPDA